MFEARPSSAHEDKDFDMIDYFCKICCGILQHQDGNPIPIYERVRHCRKFLESSDDAFCEDVSYKLLKEWVDEIVSKAFPCVAHAEHVSESAVVFGTKVLSVIAMVVQTLAVLDVTDAPADKPGTGKPAKRRNNHRSKAVEVEVIEMDKCVDVRTNVATDMCAYTGDRSGWAAAATRPAQRVVWSSNQGGEQGRGGAAYALL